MEPRKFIAEQGSKGSGRGIVREGAFGRRLSARELFGSDNSPRFGNAPSLSKDESGAAVIEYALLCALIVIAVIAGIASLGGSVNGKWSGVDRQIGNSANHSAG